jgi:hypothetical protein
MDDNKRAEEETDELMNEAWQSPPDDVANSEKGGGADEPVGPDNIRDGTVRGTMGGANKSEGQGQGG